MSLCYLVDKLQSRYMYIMKMISINSIKVRKSHALQ
jgi:hypothetical protein